MIVIDKVDTMELRSNVLAALVLVETCETSRL
jgi:hypothetical protein